MGGVCSLSFVLHVFEWRSVSLFEDCVLEAGSSRDDIVF